MTPFKLAKLSLFRHKTATLITVIAIGLSVACGGILLRLHQLSESRFSAMGKGGDAIVGAKAGGIEILLGSLNAEGDYPDFLPYKLFESLRAEQAIVHGDGATTKPVYIRTITPFVYFGKYENYRVVGTDESFYQRASANLKLEGTWAQGKGQVVLGSVIANEKGLKVGDQIIVHPWLGGTVNTSELKFQVTGVLATTGTTWDRMLFSSVEQAQEVFSGPLANAVRGKSIWGPQVLNYFLIDLYPGGLTPLTDLINKRTVGQVIDIEKQKERLHEISGVGKSIGLFVTTFVILLGGLSVCAVLITRFEGMSSQLAVLRALGYTKKELGQWLLWEGFLLGLMGVVLGVCFDLVGFPILRSLLGSALPPSDLVPSSIFGSAVIWIVAISATVLSVIIPLARVARQDTHASLRGQ